MESPDRRSVELARATGRASRQSAALSSASRRTPLTSEVISILNDRWSLRVLDLLADRGWMRRAELWRATEGISQKVLTGCLRRLEARGLVERRVESSVTISVSYRLTGLGSSLLDVVTLLRRWTEEHADELEAGRVATHSDSSA